MSDVPIIGQNDNADESTAPEVRVFHKAVTIVMDENGDCFFIDYRAPIETFTEASSNDVVSMGRLALDRVLMQQQAAVMMRTQMEVAAQVQAAQQNRAIMEGLRKQGVK